MADPPSTPAELSDGSKTAIITGCSSGIGLASTLLFLKNKYHVFGIDVSPFDASHLEKLNEVHDDQLKGDRPEERFKFHQADLLEDGACEEAIVQFVKANGAQISVLANVAGVMDSFASADTLTDAEWSRVIGINLTVPTKMMRAVLPHMKAQRRGSIVNVSSKAGTSGAVAGIAYTASKHGLIGATRNVAWRFHNKGITCNAVLPGGVNTNIHKSINREIWDQEAFSLTQPIHHVHCPDPSKDVNISAEDVANAIFFLASDEAKMINGVCLPVDTAWGVI